MGSIHGRHLHISLTPGGLSHKNSRGVRKLARTLMNIYIKKEIE